jgi:hypothetical protein
MWLSFMLRRVIARTAVVLMSMSLVFSEITSAHNISVSMAQTRVMKYSERVMNEPNSRYVEAKTNCERVFPGHNHYVRCTVQYEDRRSKRKDGVFACTEKIEVFFQPHNRGEEHVYYMRHTSRGCGSEMLSSQPSVLRGSRLDGTGEFHESLPLIS